MAKMLFLYNLEAEISFVATVKCIIIQASFHEKHSPPPRNIYPLRLFKSLLGNLVLQGVIYLSEMKTSKTQASRQAGKYH